MSPPLQLAFAGRGPSRNQVWMGGDCFTLIPESLPVSMVYVPCPPADVVRGDGPSWSKPVVRLAAMSPPYRRATFFGKVPDHRKLPSAPSPQV